MADVGDIRYKFLSDEAAKRIYRDHPQMKASSDDYCPTCLKEGTYLWKGEKHECDCEMQLQLYKHYLAAGIGENYQRLSWADYEGDPKLKDALDLYLEQHERFASRGVGVLLYGGYGVGKTFGVTMLLKDLVKEGYRCYATTFAAMIEMFTAGWKNPEEQRFFQQNVVRSDILLLDDVGRELRNRSKLSESTFDDTLRQRVQNGRPTFITTNMSLGELQEGYGSAILSLLREVSMNYELKGTDFRPTANRRMMNEIMAGETRPIV